MGPLPALGNFFSPYYGIWPHFKETKLQSLLQTDAISAETEVFSDQRKVPHIFSKNKESLYFTFGYVTAQDRLFQMYLTSRAAEGRVSEIIGPQALPYDKMMREINFKASTQKMISAAYSESELKSYVGAYVNGVNAYIKTLTPQTMPWEFLFFDVKLPEWRLLDSTLIYQNINWEMSKTTTSRTYSALLKKTDLNHLLELFPYFSSFTVPIFPDKKRLQDALGKKMSHDDAVISQQLVSDEANQSNIFKTCSAEEAQETCTLARSAYTSAAPTKDQQVLKILHEAMNGSNNWVLSGKKTKNGYPLLANDPHLNLTIPSVWYEAQLSSGDLNVYGVTLPGIPFIAIGFNKNIAWGITNGADNAIEYYSVKTQTNNNNEKEFYNGEKWEKLSSRTEQIFTKQKEPVLYKIYETPHGSISNLEGHSFDVSIPESSVMRWNNDNLGQEFKAFYNINRAKNYSEFVSAISLHVSPFFNFAFAARDGDIALWHQGKFKEHKKPAPIIVQDYVQLNKVTDDFINVSDNPHLLNPESDYIYSANQEPVSSTYPYFFPGKYESYSRPNRINDVLKNLKQATPQDMMRLQNDNMSLYARDFLSKFFSLKLNNYNFSSVEKDALKILEKWDYFYSADSIAATLFDEWQTSLRKFLWASLFFEADGKMLSLPSYERNLEFFNNPDLKLWFTAENLEAQLTYNQILSLSFKEALQKLSKNKNWEFRKVLALNIPNVARLPGFGENNLLIGGSEYSPNAVEYSPKAHGPSWRMVVSFKKDGLDAWGVLPGGASGNPASPNYAYAVGSWAKGEYYPLLFMQDKPMSSPTQKFETSQ